MNTLLGQIYKLHFAIDREDDRFWWKPWFDGHFAGSPAMEDYSNYIWHVSTGWLWWSAEIHWQKSRWGWNQLSKDEHDPLFWIGH